MNLTDLAVEIRIRANGISNRAEVADCLGRRPEFEALEKVVIELHQIADRIEKIGECVDP